MIIRTPRRTTYTNVPNDIINDETLSPAALGLVCYLLSKPNDWEVNVRQLRARFGIGPAALRTITAELRDAGYLVLRRGGVGGGGVYDLTETPKRPEQTRSAENPNFAKPELRETRTSGNTNYAKPAPILNTELRPITETTPTTDRASDVTDVTSTARDAAQAAHTTTASQRWAPFFDRLSVHLGGARVTAAKGKPLAWAGETCQLFGKATNGDLALALGLLDEFARSDEWRFYSPKNTVAAGKWLRTKMQRGWRVG